MKVRSIPGYSFAQIMAAILLIAAFVRTSLSPIVLKVIHCRSDLDCSLNGKCYFGTCVCDQPWIGNSCSQLSWQYADAASNAGGVYPTSDYNTWSGPILKEKDVYHLYVPLYENKSLFHTIDMLHGKSKAPEGPYAWKSLGFNSGINPALLVFPANTTTSDTTATVESYFSLWVGGRIHISSSPNGPFQILSNATYPDSNNPAPIYHQGRFYMTSQHTRKIWTTASLIPSVPWTLHSQIDVDLPKGTTLEDPTMWVDSRGNWHILNHAYDTSQRYNCSKSVVSSHLFSANEGKTWCRSPQEPYGHTIGNTAGGLRQHAYTTLERPYILRNGNGELTHLVLAADLETGDEGCTDTPACKGSDRFCSCVNCKWNDLAGTIVVALK